MRHGALIHIGSSAPLYLDKNGSTLPNPVIGSSWRILTYWSLNAAVKAGTFYHTGNSVIIKRITPTIMNRIINLNPYEIMIVGPVDLEPGDVIIGYGHSHFPYLQEGERIIREENLFSGTRYIECKPTLALKKKNFIKKMKIWERKGIKVVQGPDNAEKYGDGHGGEDGQTDVLLCLQIILEELNCWQIDLPAKFWTHHTAFCIDESAAITNHGLFFSLLSKDIPHASLGY